MSEALEGVKGIAWLIASTCTAKFHPKQRHQPLMQPAVQRDRIMPGRVLNRRDSYLWLLPMRR